MTGRKTLALTTLCGVVIIAILFHFLNPDEVWHLWNVPTMDPGFKDLRDVITGIEPTQTVRNSTNESYGLVGGYPKIWLLLGGLGINSSDINWLAFAMFCLFWGSLFLFAG